MGIVFSGWAKKKSVKKDGLKKSQIQY